MLADIRSGPGEEGGEDAERSQRGRRYVVDRGDRRDRVAGAALGGHHPAARLHDRVEARQVGKRPGAPVGGDGAPNEPGERGSEHLVAQPEPVHAAGPQVVDQDVRPGRQA